LGQGIPAARSGPACREQRVYVANIDEASAALEVRKAACGGKDLPASSMAEVSRLALPQLKFEVAVVARLEA
jgi:enamine deaminase RidA (YjgF/YER057c/UK114 family)